MAGINPPHSDGNANGSGAVYVFRRVGGNWVQEAYVKASNPRATASGPAGLFDAAFGTALALDDRALVVGSVGESSGSHDQNDTSASGAGAVYAFERVNGSWLQKAYLKSPVVGMGPLADLEFGLALALTNDRLIVGSPSAYGIAHVFHRSSSSPTWTFEASLQPRTTRIDRYFGAPIAADQNFKASNVRAGAGFGASISLRGMTLAVGAPEESSVGVSLEERFKFKSPPTGAVYVF